MQVILHVPAKLLLLVRRRERIQSWPRPPGLLAPAASSSGGCRAFPQRQLCPADVESRHRVKVLLAGTGEKLGPGTWRRKKNRGPRSLREGRTRGPCITSPMRPSRERCGLARTPLGHDIKFSHYGKHQKRGQGKCKGHENGTLKSGNTGGDDRAAHPNGTRGRSRFASFSALSRLGPHPDPDYSWQDTSLMRKRRTAKDLPSFALQAYVRHTLHDPPVLRTAQTFAAHPVP